MGSGLAGRGPLVALVAATAVSTVGSMLTVVALPWFVLETAGSPIWAGLVGFAAAAPALAAGPLGGVWVDRIGFKRCAVAADVVGGAAIGAIPLLSVTVGLATWQLLPLAFVAGVAEVPGITARRALVPEVAARAGTRLERANGALESTQQIGWLLGPPLAGLLITGIGVRAALWVDAATFAASAAAIWLAVPSVAAPVRAAGERYFVALREGLAFLAGDRLLLGLAIALGLLNLVANPLSAVVLPVFAREELGSPTALGLLVGAFGAGSIAGVAAFGAFGHRLPRRAAFVAPFLLVPCVYWALAADVPLAAAVAIVAVAGLSGGPLGPLVTTVRHERIPAELRGRVFGASAGIALGAAALGVAASGLAVEALGLRTAAFTYAAVGHALALAVLAAPALRRLEPPQAAESESGPSLAVPAGVAPIAAAQAPGSPLERRRATPSVVRDGRRNASDVPASSIDNP